jgi:PhnB protein
MNDETRPIPSGYDGLLPYLVIRGVAQAIEFYKELFGATELTRIPYPDGSTVMHAELQIRNSVLMLGDEAPHFGIVSPETLGGTPVSVMFYVPDVDEVFSKAVKLGAKSLMPPADMFWGDRICKFADPFGHYWMLATQKEDIPQAEAIRRAAAAFAHK